ncbi:Chromobox protein 5 [Orchesella cincta]|uniref:Chromobox protein 5 n=1 Tax=Orchesella cincta TaxID=48709 RepID=A0A1D2NIQ0_ORCCI|nr:Chromobox protein 5 [Orchesella cincta]
MVKVNKKPSRSSETKKDGGPPPEKDSPGQVPAAGFGKGLQAEKIVGATEGDDGKLLFMVKWKDSDATELVTASEAKVKCPQVVISFYEGIIKWE